MFKPNQKTFPPNFEEEVKKEQLWISSIMKKRVESRQPDHKDRERMRQALWGSSSTSTCLEEAHAKAAAEDEIRDKKHSIPFVKMEPQESFGFN